MSISVTWSTRREGNSGFVLELHPDGSHIEFGPMPTHVVLAFVAARRNLLTHKLKEIGYELTTTPTPDYFQ